MARWGKALGAALVAGGLVVAGGGAASAHDGFGHPGTSSEELAQRWRSGHHGLRLPALDFTDAVASGLAGPLVFEVDGRDLTVGQAFAGLLTAVPRGGTPTVLATADPPGGDVAAVSTWRGAVTWAERTGGQTSVTSSLLRRRGPDGTVRTVADLLAYEQAENPDGDVTYGAQVTDPSCEVPEGFGPYTGVVDTHGYGSATSRNGTTYVADAGANAVLAVDRSGAVRTVAVLPPVPWTITAEVVAALGLPECLVGATYLFESVPTDVELGHDGWLVVSTLPGGPEDGSTGSLGAVHRVHPRTGEVRTLATGLSGATNVAVGPLGTVFVAELYANEVSLVTPWGHVRSLGSVNQPAGVEWEDDRLYVSTDVFTPDGKVVAVRWR